MSHDFRSQRMDSPEGRGKARQLWDAYVSTTNRYLGPVVRPVAEPIARKIGLLTTFDLFGFWLAWHLEGGFEGLQRLGLSRSSIYRRIRLFRIATGSHPDEYEMPGVTFDLGTWQDYKHS